MKKTMRQGPSFRPRLGLRRRAAQAQAEKPQYGGTLEVGTSM
jgi:hypothetical protein